MLSELGIPTVIEAPALSGSYHAVTAKFWRGGLFSIGELGMAEEDRFWSFVTKTDTCWLWTSYINSRGYGYVPKNGTSRAAHRIAYELVIGPIPKGLEIDHLCRVRRCVRPDHLEAVTTKENILRGTCPPAINSKKTSCASGHAFTEENIYITPNGRRNCRECRRIACQKYESRKRIRLEAVLLPARARRKAGKMGGRHG